MFSKRKYQFDTGVATKLGLPAAILLDIVKKSPPNTVYDMKFMKFVLPFLKEKEIRKAIEILEKYKFLSRSLSDESES